MFRLSSLHTPQVLLYGRHSRIEYGYDKGPRTTDRGVGDGVAEIPNSGLEYVVRSHRTALGPTWGVNRVCLVCVVEDRKG